MLTWTKSVGQAPRACTAVGELRREAVAVEAVDRVEEAEGAGELVGLERADEVELDAGEGLAQRQPARLGLLHAVLAEDALPGVEDGAHPGLGLHLGDGDEGHRVGGAAGAGEGGVDAAVDVGERHGRDHSRGPARTEARPSVREAAGQKDMAMPKSPIQAASASVPSSSTRL